MSLEEQTLKEAEETLNWYRKYDAREGELVETINHLLSSNKEADMKQLIGIFESDEVNDIFSNTKRIAYMRCIMNIYHEEMIVNETSCVLDLCNSVEDFMNMVIQVKFLFWRIEFESGEDAKKALIRFIKGGGVSPQFLEGMIQYVTMDKQGMLIKLADLLLEHGMIKYAFHILWYAKQEYPESEIIITLLIGLCELTGNQELLVDLKNQLSGMRG